MDNNKNSFLKLIWIVFFTSSIVFIEPSPFDLGIIILFVLFLFQNKLIKDKSTTFLMIVLYSFLLSNIISMSNAISTSSSLRYLFITLYLLILFIFMILIINKYQDRVLNIIFSAWTLTAVITSLFTIAAYFNYIPFSNVFMKVGRPAGLFKDPNVFGPYLIPVALYSIYSIRNTKKFTKKIYWLFSFSILTFSIFISFSRGAWINYAIALTLFVIIDLIMNPSLKRFFSYFFSISIISTIFYFIIFSIPTISEMFYIRFGLQNYDTERFSSQADALTKATSNFIGIGPGQWDIIYKLSTHNSYLRIWVENGLLGILSYLSILLLSLINSIVGMIKRKNIYYVIAFSCIVGLIINSYVIDTIHWRHYWILLAIPWAILPPKYEASNISNTN